MKKRALALAALLALWGTLSALMDNALFPGPFAVGAEFAKELGRGGLGLHLGISLGRVAAAVCAAFFPALALGILAGMRRSIDNLVSPAVYVLFPVPKVALLPVIMLFLGMGNLSKIFLVALIVFFQFYLNIRDEAAGINPGYFDSLKSLGGNGKDCVFHIILPTLLPRILSSLRLTLGTAIAVLFLAETFATRTGIGWYIMDAWAQLDYDRMYAGIAALSLGGLLLFGLVDAAEWYGCGWRRMRR